MGDAEPLRGTGEPFSRSCSPIGYGADMAHDGEFAGVRRRSPLSRSALKSPESRGFSSVSVHRRSPIIQVAEIHTAEVGSSSLPSPTPHDPRHGGGFVVLRVSCVPSAGSHAQIPTSWSVRRSSDVRRDLWVQSSEAMAHECRHGGHRVPRDLRDLSLAPATEAGEVEHLAFCAGQGRWWPQGSIRDGRIACDRPRLRGLDREPAGHRVEARTEPDRRLVSVDGWRPGVEDLDAHGFGELRTLRDAQCEAVDGGAVRVVEIRDAGRLRRRRRARRSRASPPWPSPDHPTSAGSPCHEAGFLPGGSGCMRGGDASAVRVLVDLFLLRASRERRGRRY